MALFPGYTEDFENGCEQMNLSMRGIVKSFGANDVLKSVDFSLRGGEICALLGENGAGKSTLMNILGGVLRPDAGQILLDDKPQTFQNPSQSLDAGIAFIHQELNLINDLPIYENMFIGRELKKKNGFLDHPRMIAETRKVFERMALTLDPRTMVRDLDASYKQIVEISRALLMNAQIIIMDEPTTSLTDPEIEHVFEILRTLKKQNVGIVFISHKLREVMEICDRYTVLRDGVMVSEGYVRDVTTDLLARDMVGHDVRNEPLNRSVKLGDEVLRLEDLTQEPHYRHISLSVRAGDGPSGRRPQRDLPHRLWRYGKVSGQHHRGRQARADAFHPAGAGAGHRLCAAQPQGKRHHQGHEHPGKRLHRHLAPAGAPRPDRQKGAARGI